MGSTLASSRTKDIICYAYLLTMTMRIADALVLLCSLVVGLDAFTAKSHVHRLFSTSLNAKIGLFFGTSTGSTEEAANLIASEFGSDVVEGPIEIDSLKGNVAAEFVKHDALIVGTPTWNTGADTERSGTGWDEIYYGEMQDLDISGKKVAVFGLGDSVSYSENYADASGELHDVFQNLGANMLGYTSQEGYEHDDSKAIRGDKFCGLLLDAVNQEDLTQERIKQWVAQLIDEGILEGGAAIAPSTATPAAAAAEPERAFIQSSTVNGLSTDAGVIASLEQENAMLRKMLEENTVLLDETISAHGSGSAAGGCTPHYNPKTQRTMWTSADGRKCYYTNTVPKMTRASP